MVAASCLRYGTQRAASCHGSRWQMAPYDPRRQLNAAEAATVSEEFMVMDQSVNSAATCDSCFVGFQVADWVLMHWRTCSAGQGHELLGSALQAQRAIMAEDHPL